MHTGILHIFLRFSASLFVLFFLPPLHGKAQRDSSLYRYDSITSSQIQPGIYKNGHALVKRLGGVVVSEHKRNSHIQQLLISGMGDRYNQFLLNGSPMNSLDPLTRAFPLALLPTEVIESATMQTFTEPAMPSDVGGGTVSIRTKDIPDSNFIYLQAGGGFSDQTIGKEFFRDKRGGLEFIALPGARRDLPGGFPTTRSESFLNQKNIQEQIDLSKLLPNNLEPVRYATPPLNDKVMIGFGRLVTKKKGTKIGVIAFINQQQSARTDETFIQTAPDVAGNPFPFDAGKQLIRSQSSDKNYRYASQLTGVANASVSFRNNKISFRNFLGSLFDHTLSIRSQISKPDEDLLAHSGINYMTTQGKLWNTQLSGEHLLGAGHTFSMKWQATYTYYRQENPDERNFLLRQDSTDPALFEIARQASGADFTRSGRGWSGYTDHHFTGSFNLSAPFTWRGRQQRIGGGIYIESRDRLYNSDFLLTEGTGYYPLDGLLATDRYYPGGLSVKNYYTRADLNALPLVILPGNRGSYKASSNLGSAYLSLESRLMKSLVFNGGLRLESYNQLVSNIQYYFLETYRNPRYTSIDVNNQVVRFHLLPSVKLIYLPVKDITVHASYVKTVNRVALQELAAFSSYDPGSFMVTTGNPLLRNSELQNYEAGFKWSPAIGTAVSLSGFYKKIDQPVEYLLSSYGTGNLLRTPHNTPPATVKGLTASFNLSLSSFTSSRMLSAVSVFANGSLLKANVEKGYIRSLSNPELKQHRLSGSPDYMLNAGVVFQASAYPQLTVLYSHTGDYITALGSGAMVKLENNNSIYAIPDYRVKGAGQLDVQIAQKFLASRWQLIAGVHNLLNSDYTQYQDLDGNGKKDASLTLTTGGNNENGFYNSGTDNTVMHLKAQRTYYFTISYLIH